MANHRQFDERDRAGAHPVVIVDELLARTAWPGLSAIGRKIDAAHVVNGDFIPITSEVVGVNSSLLRRHCQTHGCLLEFLRFAIISPDPTPPAVFLFDKQPKVNDLLHRINDLYDGRKQNTFRLGC